MIKWLGNNSAESKWQLIGLEFYSQFIRRGPVLCYEKSDSDRG